jgi:glycosyltransferase
MTISIITVVYNNASSIEQCIQSVLSQTYPGIEYIVVDGGSADGTCNIIERYRERITSYVSEPDGGMYDALNKGIAMANGDVVGILHSDDLFHTPDVVADVALVFSQTGCDAVYGDLWYVAKDDPGRVIRNWKSTPFDVRNFYHGWMPPHPTLFMKKKVYSEFGGFDTTYKIAADYDLMLRTLGSGKLKCEYLPQVITRMRMGGASNKSLRNIWRKSMDDWRALRRNKKGGIYTLVMKNVSKLGQFFVRTQKT